MTDSTLNTRLRDRPRLAHWFGWLRPTATKNTRLPRSLSDHLARDIGLDGAQLERLRMGWPSQKDRPDI